MFEPHPNHSPCHVFTQTGSLCFSLHVQGLHFAGSSITKFFAFVFEQRMCRVNGDKRDIMQKTRARGNACGFWNPGILYLTYICGH